MSIAENILNFESRLDLMLYGSMAEKDAHGIQNPLADQKASAKQGMNHANKQVPDQKNKHIKDSTPTLWDIRRDQSQYREIQPFQAMSMTHMVAQAGVLAMPSTFMVAHPFVVAAVVAAMPWLGIRWATASNHYSNKRAKNRRSVGRLTGGSPLHYWASDVTNHNTGRFSRLKSCQ